MARPQLRYFVVEEDAGGARVWGAGYRDALSAATALARVVPEVDAREFAATFNAASASGLTSYMIGAAYAGELGYSDKHVGRRWAEP